MRLASACVLLFSVVAVALDHRGDEVTDGGGSKIATLYANDDLQSSFDFRTGSAGGTVSEGEVRLDRAQIAFDLFVEGFISFGFTRDERVEVADLGPAYVQPRARSRDRAEEFAVSVVHTLFRDDNGFAYVGPDGDVDPFERADRILTTTLVPGMRHIQPVVGNTYLLRVRRNQTSNDELFKFQVIGLIPGHSLTIRWAPVD